jgi:hypothetical protein
MKPFEELAESDDKGSVPMSELFEMAIESVYGEIETDPFICCECNADGCHFTTYDEQGTEYFLVIHRDWNIDFWANKDHLNFNRWPLYQKLIKWKFIK